MREQYPDVTIVKYHLEFRPTDAEELMKRYRLYLRKIINSTPITEAVICESGCTPQQKFALKIVSEFIFDAVGCDMAFLRVCIGCHLDLLQDFVNVLLEVDISRPSCTIYRTDALI